MDVNLGQQVMAAEHYLDLLQIMQAIGKNNFAAD
jgi:hypothetical protein